VADVELSTLVPALEPARLGQIRTLLAERDLDIAPDVEIFVLAYDGNYLTGELVACAGLAGDIVKCVAIKDGYAGTDLLTRVMTELSYVALAHGHPHLFIYTKPEYEVQFTACGFHTIVVVPNQVVMMENTPRGIHQYADNLTRLRRPGARIGSIVVNANPFTKGHQFLIQTAARDCDFLHVFVVAEDASFFPFVERYSLVRSGVAELPEHDRIHVHPGTQYIVSKATFPTYFIKDQGLVDRAATAVDLLIFREHIAPALGITHRYVGTEPFCTVTRAYNAAMHEWLEDADVPFPAVEVIEIARTELAGRPISATEVRRRLLEGDIDSLRALVPAATFALLNTKYRQMTA
jgi:[citrate (pro-3S)-lyase] ligase